MRFEALRAHTHPTGHRVDLAWNFPEGAEFPGVRVVRREGQYPVSPDDGVVVAHGLGLTAATDTGLRGETVHYYALFGYRDDPPEYDGDRHNRVHALASAPHDHAAQMYELLPPVYHRYDRRLPELPPPSMSAADRARGQLRRFLEIPGGQFDLLHSYARAALDLRRVDKVDGALLPLLADWIGWNTDQRLEFDAQRNEIAYAPYLYKGIGLKPTLEATVKRISNWESRTKEFVHNVFRASAPPRLNLWFKTATGDDWSGAAHMLSLDEAFEGRPAAVRDAGGALWLFYHTRRNGRWQIWTKRHDGTDWLGSMPLPQSRKLNKYPTAALAGGTPWAFWSEYDAETRSWHIVSSMWQGAAWSAPEPLAFSANNPRHPLAFTDGATNVWLFWIERTSNGWQLRYNRHNGANWGAALDFPLDAGSDARVDSEPFVLFDAAAARIAVFWSREITIAPGQTRREIAWRVKSNVNFNAADWSAVATLPRPAGADYHDREPAARVNAAGRFELFWSSSRGSDGYGIWRSTLTNEAANTWSAAQRVTEGPYAARDPLPLAVAGDVWLWFRSNESLNYPSETYGATLSTDFRYAGSTCVDTRDAGKRALRGEFEDFNAYTYDAGTLGVRDNADWYARDTVGLYLATDTLDPDRIEAGRARIEGVLREFMPITDRAVFITATDEHDDYVYSYSAPGAPPSFIQESFNDVYTTVIEEMVLGPGEDFSDSLS